MDHDEAAPVSRRQREERRRRVEMLADLSGAALEGLGPETLFEEVCFCTGEVLGHDGCLLWRAEGAEGPLELWALVGWSEEELEGRMVEATADTPEGWTLLRREPVTVRDLRDDDRFTGAPLISAERAPARLTALVWGTNGPWGVLALHYDQPREFEPDDPAFLEAVGHVMGRGVESEQAERELAEYAHRLERANEELEQFTHVVSHDLKEPIRNTHLYLDLLEDRFGERMTGEEGELVRSAKRGARRAREMIDGLLRYSRIDAHGIEREPVHTGALLDDVLCSMSARIDETDAEIEHGELPTVSADPAQLGQVFQNLLSNAIKFAKPEMAPRIEIEAVEVGEGWRFSVHDHGQGMDQEDADELFQMFRQGEDGGEGTGIGLAVCKKIVQRHGGRIWVETELGEGSTFHFTVPKVDGDREG